MSDTWDFSGYLGDFEEHPALQLRIQNVLRALPRSVIEDFQSDPRFQVSLDNHVPGEGSTVWMACPGAHGSGARSVVLRPRLEKSSEAFAHYVIAHEFAHAFLRNGGWGSIVDPEQAADALAENWGFPRPAISD